MKWIAKARSLVVEDGTISREIEADSQGEARSLAMLWARKSTYTDAGSVDVEPMEEDKQLICDRLLDLLQITRGFYDVENMTYKKTSFTEKVEVLFRSGHTKTVNVEADSGVAMIRDILKWIS